METNKNFRIIFLKYEKGYPVRYLIKIKETEEDLYAEEDL